jgi:hypothetical protein
MHNDFDFEKKKTANYNQRKRELQSLSTWNIYLDISVER